MLGEFTSSYENFGRANRRQTDNLAGDLVVESTKNHLFQEAYQEMKAHFASCQQRHVPAIGADRTVVLSLEGLYPPEALVGFARNRRKEKDSHEGKHDALAAQEQNQGGVTLTQLREQARLLKEQGKDATFLEYLAERFNSLNRNGDGVLSPQEMLAGIQQKITEAGATKQQLEALRDGLRAITKALGIDQTPGVRGLDSVIDYAVRNFEKIDGRLDMNGDGRPDGADGRLTIQEFTRSITDQTTQFLTSLQRDGVGQSDMQAMAEILKLLRDTGLTRAVQPLLDSITSQPVVRNVLNRLGIQTLSINQLVDFVDKLVRPQNFAAADTWLRNGRIDALEFSVAFLAYLTGRFPR